MKRLCIALILLFPLACLAQEESRLQTFVSAGTILQGSSGNNSSHLWSAGFAYLPYPRAGYQFGYTHYSESDRYTDPIQSSSAQRSTSILTADLVYEFGGKKNVFYLLAGGQWFRKSYSYRLTYFGDSYRDSGHSSGPGVDLGAGARFKIVNHINGVCEIHAPWFGAGVVYATAGVGYQW